MKNRDNYDVIGDVHGHLDHLIRMIEILGYDREGKTYSHPDGRKMIFVGDLINRGPDSLGVLRFVRGLHENGNAHVCLGNHEFRLIQQSVAQPTLPSSELKPFVGWLRSLPLFLEMTTFRVVHAAWHFSSINVLRGILASEDRFIIHTLEKDNALSLATKRVLTGIKVRLPEKPVVRDRFGIPRSNGLVKWWENLRDKPLDDCLFPPMKPSLMDAVPSPEDLKPLEAYGVKEKVVFVGHYCLPMQIPKINNNVVCVDGCVSYDEKLWAYRFSGETVLSAQNLIFCES